MLEANSFQLFNRYCVVERRKLCYCLKGMTLDFYYKSSQNLNIMKRNLHGQLSEVLILLNTLIFTLINLHTKKIKTCSSTYSRHDKSLLALSRKGCAIPH